MRRPVAPAQERKVALQARLLARGCDHLLRGAVPGWRDWLAHATATADKHAPVQLRHGRFDVVCSPRNVYRLREWFAISADTGTVGGTWVHAGHLATEPAMAQALRNVLRGDAC